MNKYKVLVILLAVVLIFSCKNDFKSAEKVLNNYINALAENDIETLKNTIEKSNHILINEETIKNKNIKKNTIKYRIIEKTKTDNIIILKAKFDVGIEDKFYLKKIKTKWKIFFRDTPEAEEELIRQLYTSFTIHTLAANDIQAWNMLSSNTQSYLNKKAESEDKNGIELFSEILNKIASSFTSKEITGQTNVKIDSDEKATLLITYNNGFSETVNLLKENNLWKFSLIP
jgi:hypothetical protein